HPSRAHCADPNSPSTVTQTPTPNQRRNRPLDALTSSPVPDRLGPRWLPLEASRRNPTRPNR
ncbi:MAG: hypothetical protein ACYDDF_14885, partial [Thermoplasmatota archaeon]